MYKDIITYELADGVTKQQLMEVAQKVVDEWMKKQAGFQGWEIHKNTTIWYTDSVYWSSETDAKQAEKNMKDIPNAAEWFACYKDWTIKSTGVHYVARFMGDMKCEK